MGGASREGAQHFPELQVTPLTVPIGGKVKPLKAPKKEKKELDEDELAFKEKQRAGEWFAVYMFVDLLSVTFANLEFTIQMLRRRRPSSTPPRARRVPSTPASRESRSLARNKGFKWDDKTCAMRLPVHTVTLLSIL